jgi:energy-converting hydrogenase Eha subunit H
MLIGIQVDELVCCLLQILWMIPVSWLQWLLVMIGMMMSGSVLVITVLPAFKNDKKQVCNDSTLRQARQKSDLCRSSSYLLCIRLRAHSSAQDVCVWLCLFNFPLFN